MAADQTDRPLRRGIEPETVRGAVIARACAGDEELRHQVESLLQSAVDASPLFEVPALNTPGASEALAEATGIEAARIGTLVGPYRIVRELGHGGMGSVYLAERADGEFEQHVAIKFVAGGVLNDVLSRRFREERRILATLDHPNIARLLDGGTTADGLPYVVMEYVAGEPIEEFCRSHGLGVRAQVQLVQRLCAAVRHAHQRLIIHRDVKPSNILVTPDGTPKLLDFGIATLADPGPLPRARTLTRALTLETASPEQLRGDTITIAVDIYALGLLLFQLLTGQSPYASKSSSEPELISAICEEVPAAPSSVVAAGGSARAHERIERDLDLIVLKALRKEPDRRYQSVAQFSDDLQRYLDGRPVLAAPDSGRYRAAKFIRRHRAGVAAASVAIAAVLGGAAVAAYQARVAQLERARAEQRFQDVRRLTDSFLFEFHDAIADLPGSLKARQLVVKRATEYLDGLANEARDDVTLQRELATANQRLATILGGGGVSNLGDFPGAQARYARALELRERLATRTKPDAADIASLAELHVTLARFLAGTADLARAEDHAVQAVSLLESLSREAGAGPNYLGELGTAYHQLGYVQSRRGEENVALRSFEQAVARARQQLVYRPDDINEIARLSRIQSDYAAQLAAAGRAKDSLDTLREAEVSLGRLLEADPLNVRHRLSLVRVFNAQGSAFRALGDDGGAVDAHTHAATTAETLQASAPEDHANNVAAMISHHMLGIALVQAGRRADGEQRLRQAIAEGESMIKAQPGDGWSLNQLAAAKLDLAVTLLAGDAWNAEGCRQIGEGLHLWDALAARGEIPGETANQRGAFERRWAACQRHGIS